eukprot:3328986-Pyramimonas_sp.AAC.1
MHHVWDVVELNGSSCGMAPLTHCHVPWAFRLRDRALGLGVAMVVCPSLRSACPPSPLSCPGP